MEETNSIVHLREVMVFLGVAGVIIPVLHRLRISPVLGFLVLGSLLGPHGIAAWLPDIPQIHWFTIEDDKEVHWIAELGVVLLLFVIGLELSLERLISMKRWVLGVGSFQVALSALAIGGLAFAFGNSIESSLVLGLGLALSSTAIVMQVLGERGELSTPMGRASFSVLLLQDLAVVPLILLVGILGAKGDQSIPVMVAIAFGKAILAVTVILMLGRWVLRPFFHVVAMARQPETFMAMTLLSILGIAAITEMAGLSMALGAFLAGLLLAETEFRHEIEVTIEPFKGLLLGLFFITVGMGIDFRALLLEPFWIFASVLGLFLIKAAIMGPLFRAFGLPRGQSIEAALLLGQGGEFAFIVVGMALANGLMAKEIGQFMLLVVSFSMMATPLIARLGSTLAQRYCHEIQETSSHLPDLPSLEGHVVIAGFGRVGQLLGQLLTAQGIAYVGVDRDSKAIKALRIHGAPVFYGDAMQLNLLKKLHLEKASAIVVTLDNHAVALGLVSAIRREYPLSLIIARAHDREHAQALKEAGANSVIPETVEVSLQMAETLLEEMGIPHEIANQTLRQAREKEMGLQKSP